MLTRVKQLYRNAGLWGIVRTVLVLGVVIAVAVAIPMARPAYWPVVVGAAIGLLVPYFSRAFLIKHLSKVQSAHRYAGLGILAVIFILREPIRQAGPVTLAICLGVLAAYISLYFWLLSDPEVVVRKRSTPARK